MRIKERLRKLEQEKADKAELIDIVIFCLLPASFDETPIFNNRATCNGQEFARLEHETEEAFIDRISDEVRERGKIKMIALHPETV